MIERSTVELIVLMITATVCTGILLSGAAIIVIEVVNPETDTSEMLNALTHVLTVLLGVVLGLLAGRGDRTRPLHQRPGGQTDEL